LRFEAYPNLQRSLRGNAKTVILCNINPAQDHVEESSDTLRFDCRAKKVANTTHVNEVLSDASLLKRRAKQIENPKKRLAESGQDFLDSLPWFHRLETRMSI